MSNAAKFAVIILAAVVLYSLSATTILSSQFLNNSGVSDQQQQPNDATDGEDAMEDGYHDAGLDDHHDKGQIGMALSVVNSNQDTETIETTNNQNQKHNHHLEKRAPLIFGAGRGATGTHTMTQTMCSIGIPSVHYNVGCIPKQDILPGGILNEEVPNVNVISRRYTELFRWSDIVRTKLSSISSCVHYSNRCPQNALLERIRDDLVDAIDKLIKYTTTITMKQSNDDDDHDDANNDNGKDETYYNNHDGDNTTKHFNTMLSFHDHPYPSLMPTIIRTVQKYYNGSMPSIIFSEREPVEYVRKRIKYNQAGADLLCKEQSRGITSEMLEYGAFDVIGCIDQYFVKHPKRKSKATIQDAFTTVGKLYNDVDDGGQQEEKARDEEREKVIEYAALQVGEYQDAVRAKAIFSVNLFEEKVRLTKDTLAEKMLSSVDVFAPLKEGGEGRRGEHCEYVNIWRKMRISEDKFKL